MDFFVHITGSAPRSSGSDAIVLIQRTAYEMARALLREKIGVVALVGGSLNEKTAAFDDEILQAAADHLTETGEDGVLIQTVRHQTRWIDRIGDVARENLRLLANHARAESLPDDEYFGGDIRNAQAELSDGAIVIGGHRGVSQTARLLMDSRPPKPVDEIFVKGIGGGLSADVRTHIDESRDWDSKADLRTVHEESDCARIAYAVASDIALRLRKQAVAASGETKREALSMKNNDEFQRDHVVLNSARREALNTHMQALDSFLSNNLDGFRKTERQGSHALGTIIRPTTDDAKADADMLVIVDLSTIDHRCYVPQLARALTNSDAYRDKVEVKNKCVTVHYSERSKLEVNLVPCVESDGRFFICPRDEDGFQETDGTGYREWFNHKNEITSGNLKRVVRLLKYTRDHRVWFECPSIVLTTLAAETIKQSDRGNESVSTQADALTTVLERMSEKLGRTPYPPTIANPALPSEKFDPKWSRDGYSRFNAVIRQMANDAKSALRETDKEKAIAKWQKVCGENFGGVGSSERSAPTSQLAERGKNDQAVSQPPHRGGASTTFISYSRESESHKDWVESLASRLKADGVKILLDEWEVELGDEIPRFMEESPYESEFTLVICTPQYKSRCDNREGGVGYEGRIMAEATLRADGNMGKIIPILRLGDWDKSIPAFLAGIKGVDLSGDPYSESEYENLLQTMLRVNV